MKIRSKNKKLAITESDLDMNGAATNGAPTNGVPATGSGLAQKISGTFVLLGAATVLSFAGLSGPAAAPASADTSGCVTKDEFHKVKRHMSKHRVKRIFDTGGRQEFRSGRYSSREYNACRRFGSVWVDYKSGDVSGKMAIW